MIAAFIDQYYCCLNTAERTALEICAANAGPLTYFVVKTLIDAAFLLALEGSSSERQSAFVDAFQLTEGTVPPEDPDGIHVYYLDVEFWDSVNVYLDEHGVGCGSPCKFLTFPE